MSRDINQSVSDRARRFANDHVANRPELHQQKDFPADIWQGLIDHDLMGIVVPEEHGGMGQDYATMATVAETLAAEGGNQGVVMTWLGHNMNAALHLGNCGTDDQQKTWLPRVARGESSLTVAISEPGAGAHPKLLKTAAVRDGNDFILNGEKSYLTNGPLADLFLVLAVTGEEDGRKSFSAFLVPRDTPGVEQTPGIEIDFLHPSPHCGLKLTDCRLPADSMVGEEGKAFDHISLTMRTVEDALGCAISVGMACWLLDGTAGEALLKESVATLGELSDQLTGLRRLAHDIARDLDQIDQKHLAQTQDLMPLIGGFRYGFEAWRAKLEEMLTAHNIEPDLAWQAAWRDILKMSGIASRAWQVRALKQGQSLVASRAS